jgi:hypothetical protein
MEIMNDEKTLRLFDFEASSKEAWLKLIEKEIQPKTWQDLNVTVGKSKDLNAAYHSEDQIRSRNISRGGFLNHWLIAEDFDALSNPMECNERLLIALEYGLEAPNLHNVDPFVNLEFLLKGVIPGYISLCWELPEIEGANRISQYLRSVHTEPNLMEGAFLPRLILDHTFIIDLKKIESAFDEGFSNVYRWIQIASADTNKSEPFGDELGFICFAFHKSLELLSENGMLNEEIISRFHISIQAGDQLLTEVSRIRALRILLANIQKLNGLSGQTPVFIQGKTDISCYTSEPNYNRIKGALIGWALATGGVDSINIAPGNLNPPASEWAFNSRIARNISHLLRMESYLAEVNDPASGAYFLEEMTNQVVKNTWKTLQEMESIRNVLTLS